MRVVGESDEFWVDRLEERRLRCVRVLWERGLKFTATAIHTSDKDRNIICWTWSRPILVCDNWLFVCSSLTCLFHRLTSSVRSSILVEVFSSPLSVNQLRFLCEIGARVLDAGILFKGRSRGICLRTWF